MSRKKSFNKIKLVAAAAVVVAAALTLGMAGSISGISRAKNDSGVSDGGSPDVQVIGGADDAAELYFHRDVSNVQVKPSSVTLSSGENFAVNNIETVVEYTDGESEIVSENVKIVEATGACLLNDDGTITVLSTAITKDTGAVTVEYEGHTADIAVTVYNRLSDDIDSDGFVTNASAYDVVVNKERNLARDYVPEDLVTVSVPTLLNNSEVNKMRKDAADALAALFKAAEEEAGYELYARSGYRSYSTQSSTYSSNVAAYGQAVADTFSAKPGQSEHQTGLAMDISCAAVNYMLYDTFGNTAEGKWVNENAHRFGFIIRYPKGKEDVTGYMYEPWHIRYMGNTLAESIYESGLTVEEYYENLEKEYSQTASR